MPRILPRVLKKRPRAHRHKLKEPQLQTFASPRPRTCLPIHLPDADASCDEVRNSSTESASSNEFMDIEYLDQAFDETIWKNLDPLTENEYGNNVSDGFNFINAHVC